VHALALPCIAMSAINAYLGAYHLIVALRRPMAREHLPFALLCLAVAAYDVFCVGLYNASSLAQGVFWQGFQLQTVILIAMTTVWFVGRLTRSEHRRGVRWLTGWFVVLLPFSFLRSADLTISTSTPAIKHIGGALHPLITYYESDLGPIFLVMIASAFIAYVYLVHLLLRHYRKQPSRNALALLVGNISYFVGIINDSLVSSGVYQFVYISEYAFFILTLAMAYVLLNKFVDLQCEVEALNVNLERSVAQRTAALQRSLEQQRAMQRQLVAASRRSGMADVATHMLHNLGNALNSITVSLGVLQDTLRQSRVAGLSKVVHMISGDDGGSRFFSDEARARRVPDYLAASAAQLEGERASLHGELASLRGHVEHIQAVVATQELHTDAPAVHEITELPAVLDEALSASLVRHEERDVEIERDYAAVPEVALDRNKLLQILSALLDNAWRALDGPAAHRKCIRLRLHAPTGNQIAIEIADSGRGIAPENLTRIFHQSVPLPGAHGSHLHASACAATEMGGSLIATSDGPGRGACFTLTLPLRIAREPS